MIVKMCGCKKSFMIAFQDFSKKLLTADPREVDEDLVFI